VQCSRESEPDNKYQMNSIGTSIESQDSDMPLPEEHFLLPDFSLHSTWPDDREFSDFPMEPVACFLRTISPATVPTPFITAPLSTPDESYMFDQPLLPSENRLQSNVVSRKETQEYVITWSYDDDVSPDTSEGDALEALGRGKASSNGEFVRSLKLGDVVTVVWAKARFPGWANYVDALTIDVYWLV